MIAGDFGMCPGCGFWASLSSFERDHDRLFSRDRECPQCDGKWDGSRFTDEFEQNKGMVAMEEKG